MEDKEDNEAGNQLLENIRELLEISKQQKTEVSVLQELKKIIKSEISDTAVNPEISGDIAIKDLTESLSSIKMSHVPKLRVFSKGQNFSRFCERFIEYVCISKIRDPNMYLLFLQNVDDVTHTRLKGVLLTDEQKANAKLFCQEYKQVIYGDEKFSLKYSLLDCKQKSGETISDYVYRLTENADIAYNSDRTKINENCLLIFLRGVRDPHLKMKLSEATLSDFEEAVKLAKKIERVDTLMNKQKDDSSVRRSTSSNREEYKMDNRQKSHNDQRGRPSRYPRPRPDYQNRRYRRGGNHHRYKQCWKCGVIGHVMRFCWKSNNQSLSQPPTNEMTDHAAYNDSRNTADNSMGYGSSDISSYVNNDGNHLN